MSQNLALLAAALTVLQFGTASAAFVPGGGPARKDCRVQLQVSDAMEISGKKVSCTDGAACDADGVVNGVCQFASVVCVNVPDPSCPTTNIKRVKVSSERQKKSATLKGQVTALQDAVDALGAPITSFVCSAAVGIPVAIKANKGQALPDHIVLKLKANPGGTDHPKLECVPSSGGPTTTTQPTETTTTTSPAGTTTTTLSPIYPRGGLQATLSDPAIDTNGIVTVTLQLTDDKGLPVTPVTAATDDPDEARVRLTIAYIDEISTTVEGVTSTFTRYLNYILVPQTSPITQETADQPSYDTGGSFTPIDAAAGLWKYTFGTQLPADYPATFTHTIGGQVEREYEGQTLSANPLLNFVPTGAPVTVERQDATTGDCNTCHDPLEAHGGARRELQLCQLCHTSQGVDPDTGNSIELLQMVHMIHRGAELPSVENGPVGTTYSIVGFRQQRAVFAEKVKACSAGAFAGLPCEDDADCGSGGTCTSTTTVGVEFPQTIENCGTTCHANGETVEQWNTKPAVGPCASCHDDVNPGTVETKAGPPGTNHVAGAQPEALCRVCHTPTGAEFGLSVQGAHTNPLGSTEVNAISGTLVSAAGGPGQQLQVTFRISDESGVLTSLASLSSVTMNANGPTTDYARATPLRGAVKGTGSNGTLTGPDGTGLFTYTFPVSAAIPADATGTWTVGMEARKSQTIDGSSVNVAIQNPTLSWAVTGDDVVEHRVVVEQEKCDSCHGVFSVDFSVHGTLRNQVAYCDVCHAPNANDFTTRQPMVAGGASPITQSIHLKYMVHKLHRGEDLAQQPYIVYGRNSVPAGLGEIRFPGNLADCATCHADGTYLLPLPAGVLPTKQSHVDGSSEVVDEPLQPISAACLSCHDSDEAIAHAATNTAGTVEACGVCHGEGSVVSVSAVHAQSSGE